MSHDFDKWQDEARKLDAGLCLVIFFGNEFKLKSLSFVCKCFKSFIFSFSFTLNFWPLQPYRPL